MPETLVNWPAQGIIESSAHGQIPPGFTPDALNVRPFDTLDERLRGGQRPGTDDFLGAQINGSNPIQRLVQGTTAANPGASDSFSDVFPYADGVLETVSSGVWNERSMGVTVGDGTSDIDVASNTVVFTSTASDRFAFRDPPPTIAGTYSIEATMQVDFNNATDGAGIACRMETGIGNNAGMVYLLLEEALGDFRLHLRKRNSGVNATLGVATGTAGTGITSSGGITTPATIRLTVTGNSFEVFANGVSVIGPITESDHAANTAIGVAFFQLNNNNSTFVDDFALLGTAASTRSTKLAIVSGGNLYVTDSPPITATLATGGTGVFNPATFYMGGIDGPPSPSDGSPDDIHRHIYFCDSASYIRLDLDDDTASTWTAAAGKGTLPADGAGNVARIITLYRNRIVLAGLLQDPQNWFMSRVGDPLDWDTAPAVVTATQAVAGNVSDAGVTADLITALFPHSDDVLLIGMSSSIAILQGDPASGGRIDDISNQVGIVGPNAITRDPFGNLYFMGTNGFNRLAPRAGTPELLSTGKLDKTFSSIDIATTNTILVWDRDRQGCHIFFSNYLAPSTAPTHFWFDARTNGFWPEQYPINNGPTHAMVFDGDDPTDRAVLMGGFDSRVYTPQGTRKDDDNSTVDTAIDSFVDFVLLGAGGRKTRTKLNELQFVLDKDSDNVDVSVFTGRDPETAIEATDTRFAATIKGGRNRPLRQRVAGHSIRIRLRQNLADTSWAFEEGHANIETTGRIRGHVSV